MLRRAQVKSLSPLPSLLEVPAILLKEGGTKGAMDHEENCNPTPHSSMFPNPTLPPSISTIPLFFLHQPLPLRDFKFSLSSKASSAFTTCHQLIDFKDKW